MRGGADVLLERGRQLEHVVDVAAGPRPLAPLLKRELAGNREVGGGEVAQLGDEGAAQDKQAVLVVQGERAHVHVGTAHDRDFLQVGGRGGGSGGS